MREIQLTQGQVAIVDDDDYERVNAFKWTAQKIKQKERVVFYAKRTVWSNWSEGSQETILLHRFIMNAEKGTFIDHKNGNSLDCRKNNLRTASRSENNANRRVRRMKPVQYKGVDAVREKFKAQISVNGKTQSLGLFSTQEAAAIAYDQKARELFGEFASLNFPEERIDI